MSMSTDMILDFEGQTPATELGGYEPIPNGVYDARIIGAELKRTKDTNRPMVVQTWQIIGGEQAGKKVNYDNVVFSSGGVRFILARTVALGITLPKRVSAEEAAGTYAREALGKIAQITVTLGKPNDKGDAYPEVKGIAPASFPPIGGDGNVPTVEDEDVPF